MIGSMLMVDWHLIVHGLTFGDTQNRPPTRPAVGPNRSLVPRLKAALSSEDWHDLCQCVPMCCQLVTIQFFMIGADRCVQMGHLVIVIWSVWHWIGEMAMD